MGYLPHDHRQYEFAPIHIDGTGDTVFDPIASIGILYNDVYHVWVQGEEVSETEYDAEVISLSTVESESELLQSFADFVEETIDNSKTVLVGYKEETWRGGGFRKLRTRCVRTGSKWPLDKLYYSDFGEAIAGKGRFNTNVPSMKGANVTPLNDFIDFHNLDIDKSLNKTPKQNAIESAGYTVEQVREFSEATGHDVPYASLEELSEVYELFVEDELVASISDKNISNLLTAGETVSLVESMVADLTRTSELFNLADEFTSRDDWHTKQL